MFKFGIPTILIGISIAGFFIVTKPLFDSISDINTQKASLNEALDTSRNLKEQRDKLIDQSKAIDSSDIDKLKKLLPDNVDNIRLILEIGEIARPYGMVLKDVKYGADSSQTNQQGNPNTSDYGVWNFEFSTKGSYSNFLNFLRDLEKNLRIMDVVSIQFSSDTDTSGAGPIGPDVYNYSFRFKTYWLKN